jgi:hypothetical protein
VAIVAVVVEYQDHHPVEAVAGVEFVVIQVLVAATADAFKY